MNSHVLLPFDPRNVDVQLIASVQQYAGAHCHESANLIHCYQLCAHLYQEMLGHSDQAEMREMLEDLLQSEVDLRKFLWKCRG